MSKLSSSVSFALETVLSEMTSSYTSTLSTVVSVPAKKPAKAKKEKAEKLITPKAELKTKIEFSPVTPDEFIMSRSRSLDRNERLAVVKGVIAYLENKKDRRIEAIDQEAPLGSIEDQLLLVLSLNAKAWRYEKAQGISHAPIGAAGLNARVEKVIRSFRSLLMLAEHERLEFEARSEAAQEVAEELKELDPQSSLEALKEASTCRAKALVETARAASIRKILDENDLIRMGKIYDSLGGTEESEVIAVDCGSFGSHSCE